MDDWETFDRPELATTVFVLGFDKDHAWAVENVSAQFLQLQISTFDKSLIPTLTRSHMEIASLSFPLYSYPPYDLTIKTNKDKNTKTSFRYSRMVLRQP